MQINNFYSDPVPSVRSPLDSIVLSPYALKGNDFGLADMGDDPGDYQSLLPSIHSCNYYDRDSCRETNSLSRDIWKRCSKLIRHCGQRHGIKQAP